MRHCDLPPSSVLSRDSSAKKAIDKCHSRIIFIAGIMVICYALLVVRLIDVSLLQTNFEDSKQQVLAENGITPVTPTGDNSRGNIYDRHGQLLAVSLPAESLFAKPKVVARFGTEDAVAKLHKLFPDLSKKKLSKMLDPKRSFSYIKRNISTAEVAAVNRLGIPGLEFEEATRRVYPHGNLFSHILGYSDIDGDGISGTEKFYNKQLATYGQDVTLSVDSRLQHIVRDELMAGIKEFKALGGVGVVMDIHTGELLSMVSMPDYDPNKPMKAKGDARFNRAVTGVYEMGSTFKTFTTAMALHHKTANIYDRFDTTKPIRVARYTIRDSHPEDRWLNVPEIFMHSSNIGTVRMILEIGKDKQRDFLKTLGLFDRVELELPEVASPLIPQKWRDINMMTISYGHGISVTPMHLVQAIGSLLGNGTLTSPTLKKISAKQAAKENTDDPIISDEVKAQMRRMMRLVVQHGTAGKADANGYRVGGKTGTAEKVKDGNYAAKDKLASFVGIFPSEAPRYVILAMLDEPRGNKSTYGYATGGWVAAPVVKNIVEKMAPLYGIRPIISLPSETENKPYKKVKNPDIKNYFRNISL